MTPSGVARGNLFRNKSLAEIIVTVLPVPERVDQIEAPEGNPNE